MNTIYIISGVNTMKTYSCEICNKQYNTYNGLVKHLSRTHNIDAITYHIKYKLNGERPTCACGCGEYTEWKAGSEYENDRFRTYKNGHGSKVKNPMLGKKHSTESKKQMSKSRKQKFKEDENYSRWNKGVNLKEYWGECVYDKWKDNLNSPEANAKISKHFKGKPKSLEHREKILEQLEINRHNRLTSKEPSLPEKLMGQYLEELNLQYETEYPLDGFHYDFYIESLNLLIEVDGDYFHGNPKFFKTLNPMQRKNKGLDKVKNAVARDNNFNLIRFWEDDIKNDKTKIIDNIST